MQSRRDCVLLHFYFYLSNGETKRTSVVYNPDKPDSIFISFMFKEETKTDLYDRYYKEVKPWDFFVADFGYSNFNEKLWISNMTEIYNKMESLKGYKERSAFFNGIRQHMEKDILPSVLGSQEVPKVINFFPHPGVMNPSESIIINLGEEDPYFKDRDEKFGKWWIRC